MAYALGLLSSIPVIRNEEDFFTLDLWARDLEVQVLHTSRLKLFCPEADVPPENWTAVAPLPRGVEFVSLRNLRGPGVRAALADCDVLQVPAVQGWYESLESRRLLRQARRLGIRSIVGISSNRARAALLNARLDGSIPRMKALVKHASIRLAQRQLTARADGTFIVGDGLRSLVSPQCRSLHVSIASWIREGDLGPALRKMAEGERLPLDRVCIASRLERMKGVHIGIEAFARVCSEEQPDRQAQLTILGEGPERAALEAQVTSARLWHRTRFGGPRSYPIEFFEELRLHGLVLLTNLSDEQPRLIFDAISQGCIPVCPDSAAFASIGLPREVLYRQGDAVSLAHSIQELQRHPDPRALLCDVVEVARRFTLESMHRERASWIEAEVLLHSAGHANPHDSTR